MGEELPLSSRLELVLVRDCLLKFDTLSCRWIQTHPWTRPVLILNFYFYFIYFYVCSLG
jgi:hypothetical protein